MITLDRARRVEWGDDRLRVLEAHSFPHAGLLMASTSKVRCLQARGGAESKRDAMGEDPGRRHLCPPVVTFRSFENQLRWLLVRCLEG